MGLKFFQVKNEETFVAWLPRGGPFSVSINQGKADFAGAELEVLVLADPENPDNFIIRHLLNDSVESCADEAPAKHAVLLRLSGPSLDANVTGRVHL